MRYILSLTLMCILLTCGAVLAQGPDEFDAWMRTIDEKNQSVQNAIADKNSKAAVADAKALEDAFKQVDSFFVKRGGATDAVALAKQAQREAANVAKLVTGENFVAAAEESIKIAETCTSCHRLYRPLF